MSVDSVPIYWENPKVRLDFDTSSFVNVYDYHSIEAVINEIIHLDSNK
jgi:hypothetical protein